MTVSRRIAAGFTLIEMAIVIVVIGLLLSGGLLAVSPIIQQSKITETRAKMTRVEAALTVYLIQNSCLPCPATGNLASTDANAGRAGHGATTYYSTGCAAGACIASGVVPWVNLGLSEDDVSDGFNNRFTYDVTADMVDTTTTDNIRVNSTYPTGSLTVEVTSGGTVLTSTGAYVLVSHGNDGADAFALTSGATRADSFNSTNQNENSDADDTYVQATQNPIRDNTYFDDIVAYKTPANVIQGCGAGSCGNPS